MDRCTDRIPCLSSRMEKDGVEKKEISVLKNEKTCENLLQMSNLYAILSITLQN